MFLTGCSNLSDTSEETTKFPGHKSAWEDPINITQEDAERIALDQAKLDGHDSPKISSDWNTMMQSVYSIKYERDVLVYRIHVNSAEGPAKEYLFDVLYYINTDSGEIIVSNH